MDIIDQLKKLKAEIVEVEDIKGGIAGMFWRFLVADDPTVDRYVPKLRLFFFTEEVVSLSCENKTTKKIYINCVDFFAHIFCQASPPQSLL